MSVALVLPSVLLGGSIAAAADPIPPAVRGAVVLADPPDADGSIDDGEDVDGEGDPGDDSWDDDSAEDDSADDVSDRDDGTGEEVARTSTPAPVRVPAPATVTVPSVQVDGNGAAKSLVVGNGGSVPLSFTYSVRSTNPKDPMPRFMLERQVGEGTWGTAATVPAEAVEAWTVTVRTPAYRTRAAKATVHYRLRSTPFTDATTGGVGAESVSPSFAVTYENQARYRGMAAVVWRIVRPYCPNTAVRVARLSGEAGNYRTGGLLIKVDAGVGKRWNTDPSSQRALGLHECAHERQWLNAGAEWSAYEAQSRKGAKIFVNDRRPKGVRTPYPSFPARGFNPVEHAADCAAQALNPGGYLGYGGYCNPKELRAGKRLLLGKRY